MSRVDFSADDVARIRFCSAPAPLVETGFAVCELRRALSSSSSGGGLLRRPRAATPRTPPGERLPSLRRPWLDRMAALFPAAGRPLLEVVQPGSPSPGFVEPVAADIDEALEMVRAAPRDRVRTELYTCWRAHAAPSARPSLWLRSLADGDREARDVVVLALREVYTKCVAPLWDSVVHSFHADLAARVPVLVTGGYVQLFDSLHPQLAWRDQGLDRATGTSRLALDGLGLQLVPCTFWTGPPGFQIQPPELGGNALIYPAWSGSGDAGGDQPPPGGPHPADNGPQGSNSKLAAALGYTRAEALSVLYQPCGTVELAGRLHVSPSSASEHVAALRAAGLVTTTRRGRGVRHSLTPLGRSLLGAVDT